MGIVGYYYRWNRRQKEKMGFFGNGTKALISVFGNLWKSIDPGRIGRKGRVML